MCPDWARIRVIEQKLCFLNIIIPLFQIFSCSFAVALSRQRSANVTLLALLSSGGPTPLAPPVNWRREWKLPASMLHCLRSILPCGMRRNVFYGPRGIVGKLSLTN